jgi:hypothetical protein
MTTTFVNTAKRDIINEIGNSIAISVRYASQGAEAYIVIIGPNSTSENILTGREAWALMECLKQAMTVKPS